MKYLYIVLLILLFTACNQPDRLEIQGTAPGIKSGVFGIFDVLNKPIYGDNIFDGKFKINELLEYPGYYQVKVTNMLDTKATHIPYEIYLENGKYAIELNGADLTKYPKITTSSKKQNELSAYYTMADELMTTIQMQVKDQTQFLKSGKAQYLAGNDYLAKIEELKASRIKEKEIEATLVEKFFEKYPQSSITAHFIRNLDYKSDAVRYYALFNKLSDEAKNTEEGKELKEALSRLVKLVPGETAPGIYGTAPDGKPFDVKSINKKIILIDFWRAGNQVSRENHRLINSKIFFEVNNKKDFGVISLDLDEKRDWWLIAIKEDKMNWPQYSDLKGNDSKNVEAWGISRVPSYYLVDGNWKILKRDVLFDDISYEVGEYLEKKK
ncbi:MAG: thioredoxin-like domain-containing protein [Mucilaginibacter sp.]